MNRVSPRRPRGKMFSFVDRLPYSARQMFDLVAAVESYHEFMPLCERAFVIDRSMRPDGTEHLVSVLEVSHRKSGLHSVLESRVCLDRPNLAIEATSSKSPIRHLLCRWTFRDMPGGGSEAHFYVEYEMSLLPLQFMMNQLYNKIFDRISAAFRERARYVYGPA